MMRLLTEYPSKHIDPVAGRSHKTGVVFARGSIGLCATMGARLMDASFSLGLNPDSLLKALSQIMVFEATYQDST
jgi:hypothetical protein